VHFGTAASDFGKLRETGFSAAPISHLLASNSSEHSPLSPPTVKLKA